MVRSKAAQAKRKRLEADGSSAPPPRRPKTVADKKEDDGLDPKRVYVSRLPKAWTDDVLAEKCGTFGTVARASVSSAWVKKCSAKPPGVGESSMR